MSEREVDGGGADRGVAGDGPVESRHGGSRHVGSRHVGSRHAGSRRDASHDPGDGPVGDGSREQRRVEVAIIGGGCAAVAAAFELSRPEQRGRFRITLYQQGWRLGGKGASGRGKADRIEEHGLHVWLGFYENAFRQMRECYEELNRDPAICPIADWQEAFVPEPWVGLADPGRDGQWLRWLARFPARSGLPGDPLGSESPFTLSAYLGQTLVLLRLLLQSAHGGPEGADSATTEKNAPGGSLTELVDRIRRLLGVGELVGLSALLEAARLLEALLPHLPGPGTASALRLIEALAGSGRRRLESALASDEPSRRVWQIFDLVLATVRGILRFGLLTDPRGLDAIDDYDCRSWLLINGASRESLDSPFVRGLYDLALAYRQGRRDLPSIAAGSGLRGLLRMFFTYRGALFWKMQAGMGDIVFAPYYEVLRRRGVRFEFFHRLDAVRLSESRSPTAVDAPHVAALELSVQATPANGTYEPLIDVHGLPCWPSEPDFEQLVDGRRLAEEGVEFESHWDRRCVGKKTLRVGEDFDFVVLAVGLGAIPHVGQELVARDPRWRRMVEKVETVATQAFQIWMDEDMEELGWHGPPLSLSGFVHPFDTWADMSHLAGVESWPVAPKSIAYFCSVLETEAEARGLPPEQAEPARERERVRAHARRFLDRDIHGLWPRAVSSRGFRWRVLADPLADSGEEERQQPDGRFADQFFSANINPTDRYVLTLPGTSKYRISPLDPTYDNLTVAGDWTYNGHNEGCVEAAVMSGQLAAHALSGLPALEDIVGYDHP